MEKIITSIKTPKVSTIAKTARAPKVKRPTGWTLVWNDELDGEEIETTKWGFDIGNGFFD